MHAVERSLERQLCATAGASSVSAAKDDAPVVSVCNAIGCDDERSRAEQRRADGLPACGGDPPDGGDDAEWPGS